MSVDHAEYLYLLWRGALERHGVAPTLLTDEQRKEIEAQAARGCRLIRGALARPEARFAPEPDPAQVAQVLASAGIDNAALDCDEKALARAVARELRAAWVIERIVGAVTVDEDAVRGCYEQQPAQRHAPEMRLARHILITINEDYLENRRESAHARLVRVAEQWPATAFDALAARHSECPSALEGGLLGRVRRGQLYPALEEALFQLPPGAMSGIVESPLGFHLLYCEEIIPARTIDFHEAAPVIRRRLQEKAQREALRALLEGH
ncbi:MAG: peptidylprolyl isomerase [Thiohalomonadaceae bacterium]